MDKILDKIIYIDNSYYGYRITRKLIPIHEDNYNTWWWIDFLGNFDNINEVKKLYPNTSIQSINKAKIKKFIIEKIKELHGKL